MKRERVLAIALVLLGAVVAYFASSRDWIDVVLPARPPLPPVEQQVSGADVVAALRPLALLALAAVAALLATKRLGRVLVGVVVVGAGTGMLITTALTIQAGTFQALEDRPAPGVRVSTGPQPGFTPWWLLAIFGGLLIVTGGVLVVFRSRRWASMSSRYEAPAARAHKPPPAAEIAAWEAFDRGEDPTEADAVLPPRVEG